MSRGALQWWAILIPALVVGSFEFVRHSLLERLLPPLMGNMVAAVLVGVGAALYVGLAARYIRETERRLSAAREETAVLQERDRIAREMHDNVSQALFYMGIHLGDVQRQLDREETGEAAALLTEVRQNLGQTYERVRAAIHHLRQHPPARSLGASVRALSGELSRHGHLQVDLEETAAELVLPHPVQQHVLGIVQEALHNAAKHAEVDRAVVSIRRADGALEVTIADRGRGFVPQRQTSGFGLLMMQERAELIGAVLSIETEPGKGTQVRLAVPLGEGS